MNWLKHFEDFHSAMKQNRWHYFVYLLCRGALSAAFIISGMVKIVGERFADGLSAKHPMGAYLEALHHTGYYYTFIGLAQVVAALLLLIPRTVVLGALLYLPIVVNIWVLTLAVRFEGSFITAPLMVVANLYVLVWNYNRIRHIMPFSPQPETGSESSHEKTDRTFPFRFFGGALLSVGALITLLLVGHPVMPRNSLSDCKAQFTGTKDERAGFDFCACIHTHGQPLNECLRSFNEATP